MALFDWNTVPVEVLNPLLTRQLINTERLTIARLELKAGCVVPTHTHHNEQVSIVLSGRMKFDVEGEEVIVAAGQALELKPHQRHGVVVLEDSVAIDVFSPPREDWIRGDDAYLRG